MPRWLLFAGAALALVAGAAPADADDALWTLLRGGGQVIMLRHAGTDRTFGDPPGFRLEACSTQRNLTAEGREQARRLGEVFRTRGVVIGRVLSSQWCRCLQTARLAFGHAEPWPALNGGPRDAERVAARVRDVHALLATPPSGGSLVLVTHGFNIRDATGEMPAEGGLVVFTPLGGDRFTMAGRLAPAELATP
ncbi:MAG TPA: histidine phosphatase family protein [Patescibacteria group bacterium]|nr:histidine phosphatase family protein [Patescibacteria group bacterium]